MANPEHVELLKTADWNAWREEHPGVTPDFTDTVLSGLDLSGKNLSTADLSRTKVESSNLDGCVMTRVAVQGASFKGSSLNRVDLSESDLDFQFFSNVSLVGAALRNCSIKSATVREANLSACDLTGAKLEGTDFTATVATVTGMGRAATESDAADRSSFRAQDDSNIPAITAVVKKPHRLPLPPTSDKQLL